MVAMWIVGVGAVVLIAMLWSLRLIGRKFRARVNRRIDCQFTRGIEASNAPNEGGILRSRRKPRWVTQEVLKLTVRMTGAGCRKVSQAFNQQHGHRATVGKSFVADCF
jgi:hypothetical protein